MVSSQLPYNSATRLLTILSKAHSLGQERPELSAREIFASAMQAKREPSAFYESWSKLYTLIEQLKQDIQQLPEAKYEIYLRAIQELTRILSISDFSNPWDLSFPGNSTLTNPQWHGFQILELCALDLGEKEVDISPKQLTSCQAELDLLLQEILTSNLNPSGKVLLKEHIETIKEKLNHYHFYGSDGLKKAVESSLGSLLINGNELSQESDKTSIQNFLNFLKTLLSISTRIHQSLPERVVLALKTLQEPNPKTM